jgi:hypothetical protein
MKLVYCKECCDVFKIGYELKKCECGESWGQYDDDGLNARYAGAAVPLGIHNASLGKALRNQPLVGKGQPFQAFVIPEICDTYRKVEPCS